MKRYSTQLNGKQGKRKYINENSLSTVHGSISTIRFVKRGYFVHVYILLNAITDNRIKSAGKIVMTI